MKIGIVVAMDKELFSLLEKCGPYHKTLIMKNDIYTFENYPDIVIARSGVGEIRAALAATLLIRDYKVERIINFGFVGSYDPNLKLGEIVHISDVVNADVDLTAFGNKPGQYEDLDIVSFPADTSLFAGNGFKQKSLISSDQYIDDSIERAKCIETFGAHVCDMEGAGIAYVCYSAEIPFSMLKCVSNTPSDSTEDYLVFSVDGITECANLIFEMVFKQ